MINISLDSLDDAIEPSPMSGKDIWSLVRDKNSLANKRPIEERDTPQESFVFFLGNKSAGKSSLLVRFLDRDEQKNATVALEYTFCRRTRGINSIKDVCHIWELAGGTQLSELINCPLSESNITTFSFVIVVDLSQPSEVLGLLMHFLEVISSKVNAILQSLEQRGSKRPKAARSFAWKKYGPDHPDKEYIDPSVVPILIVGNKYDLMKSFEPEKQKMICKTLRYIAHTNGASLIFTTQKDENQTMKFRQLLNHFAFKTNPPKGTAFDHTKPIFVQAGSDTLSQIGNPPSVGSQHSRTSIASLEVWKRDFSKYFPASGNKETSTSTAVNTAELVEKYPEAAIDAMRAQKDEELEKVRRANDRMLREKHYFAGGGSKTSNKDKKGNSYSRSKAAANY